MLITESWLSLLIAILFGVLGTLSMKLSEGFKHWRPLVCLIVFYCISFVALTLALQGIDTSIVYALWSGIGMIFVATLGFFLFNESLSFRKVFSLFLVMAGIMGIYLSNAFK